MVPWSRTKISVDQRTKRMYAILVSNHFTTVGYSIFGAIIVVTNSFVQYWWWRGQSGVTSCARYWALGIYTFGAGSMHGGVRFGILNCVHGIHVGK